MHDGYLFTLGISGTPLGNRPAARLLLQMMAALPPVKRVAALGDGGSLHEPVLADLRDAELLLLATPAPLPPRVHALLEFLAPAVEAGLLQGKVAALAAVGQEHEVPLALQALRDFCAAAGVTVAAAQGYPLLLGEGQLVDAERLARLAYGLAEQRLPVPSLARRER